MNNIRFYPFERNNYYRGKLLTASGFEAEQKYNNDKRRLINRFAVGFGVVCGLNTVAVTKDRISVEAGIAFDGCGREIVVPAPDVKRLSSLNGYDENISGGVYYLYIEYSEKQTGEVRRAQDNNGERDFDKISEQYELYLSDIPPQADTGDVMSYYKHNSTILKKEDIEIRLIVPKFIKARDKFPVEIKIIPREPQTDMRVKFRVDLKCVRFKGGDSIDVEFDSRSSRAAGGEYSLHFICDAMNISYDMAEFSVIGKDIEVRQGSRLNIGENDTVLESTMSDRDPCDSVCDSFISQLMGCVGRGSVIDVCIAEIFFENYEITGISEFPLNQYLTTNPRLALENAVLKDRVKILERAEKTAEERTDNAVHDEKAFEISSGTAVIDLGIGGRAGKRFFSEEISHGLGTGNVMVCAGLRGAGSDENSFVYGSAEIFDQSTNGIKAETAVRVNSAAGTFAIGLRLLEATAEYNAVVQWTAIRRTEKSTGSFERRIIIDNGAKVLGIMETVYFSVRFVNMPPCDIRWTVESADGGTVDENGRYTAPNHSGVFRICARCADDSTVRASAYIVVKP